MGMAVANVNGEISKLEDAKIGVDDRGFLYGDSLYEVVFFRQSVPMFWQEHFSRMHSSAEKLGMKISQSDSEIRNQIKQTINFMNDEDKNGEIYCRWIITRGGGQIHLKKSVSEKTSLVIIAKPWRDAKADSGIRVKVTSIRRNPSECTNPAIKSGNYLNNVLAIHEANDCGFDDCLMLTIDGNVAELSRANIWFVIDGIYVTPKKGCLAGITRANIHRAIAEAGLKSCERDIKASEIGKSSEAFYSASSRDVWPIREIKFGNSESETKIYPSNGGEKTRMLMKIFTTYAQSYIDKNKNTF